MPWEKRHGLPSANHGRLYLTRVVLAHFEELDCGAKSLAFTINPSQVWQTFGVGGGVSLSLRGVVVWM
jgi:hypothetical protein